MVIALGVIVASCNDDDPSTVSATDDATTSTAAAGPTSSTIPGSLTPVSVDRPDAETAHLTDVRVGSHDGFDRITFEFDAPIPGYVVDYTTRPVTEDGSGANVPIDGAAILNVRLFPSMTARIEGDKVVPTYTGEKRFKPGTAIVVEAVKTGDFEAVVNWTFGLTQKTPFRVSTLTGPDRIVVELLAGAATP